jgi:hypothetical protein
MGTLRGAARGFGVGAKIQIPKTMKTKHHSNCPVASIFYKQELRCSWKCDKCIINIISQPVWNPITQRSLGIPGFNLCPS